MKSGFLKKCLVAILAVTMLISMLSISAFAAKDPVNDARAAVVKIVQELVYTVNGAEVPAHYYYVGSGALLATEKDPSCKSTNLVLTAYHVIDDKFYAGDWFIAGSDEYNQLVEYDGLSIAGISSLKFDSYILLDNDVKIRFTVDQNAKSEQSDWAVLRLEKTLEDIYALKVGTSSDLAVNQNVWALGFPAKLESSISQTYTKNDVIVTNGIINKTDYTFDLINATFIMHSATLAGGNSGGPLINDKGHIVGVNVMVTSLDSGSAEYSYATPIDSVTNITSKLGLGLLSANQGLDFPLWVIIAIVAAVLVIAGLVVIIIVIATSGKKKEEAAAAAATAAEAAKKAANVPHLVIQTGRLAGRRYRIEGSIKIGRDGSQCQIVYPADTAGVSGTHCEVFIQNGTIYIRDLKSSYGTFLGGGMQMQPGNAMPLAIGSTFYLASPENTFIVQY